MRPCNQRRPKISPPYFPTKPHSSMLSSSSHTSSRSSSTSSTSSSIITSIDPTDLQSRATELLKLLHTNNDPQDLSSITTELISPHIIAQYDHNDDGSAPLTKSRTAYLAHFANAPSSHIEIQEAVVDDAQRKVWVRSEISGLPGGVVKEAIDMMTFDADGVLVRSEDCLRVVRRRRE